MNTRHPGLAGILTVLHLSSLGCTCSEQQEEPHSTPSAAPSTKSLEAKRTAPPRPSTGSVVVLFPELERTAETFRSGFETIAEDRKTLLKGLALFMKARLSTGESAQVIFICSHNSRRSQMAQLWAATAAAYYGVRGVKTYSGGLESSALNPSAVAAFERAGFRVENEGGDNPHYSVKLSEKLPPQVLFSKQYDHPRNPSGNFAAVMTCSEADASCPLVEGAALRLALPYDDPKEADDTDQLISTYDGLSKKIGTEMFYLLSLVARKPGQ